MWVSPSFSQQSSHLQAVRPSGPSARLESLRQSLDVATSLDIEVPPELLRRIEALQERNLTLRHQREELLIRGVGPAAHGPSPSRSSVLQHEPSLAQSGSVWGSTRLTPTSSRHVRSSPSKMPWGHGPDTQSAPLSQRLRQYHEIMYHRQQEETEDYLGQALEQRVLRPLDQVQQSLQALADSQRRMQEEQQRQIQHFEAQGAKQQHRYHEEVLQLEEALLSQSVRREEDLAAELRELEREWQELQVADARVRRQAVQLSEMAASQSSGHRRSRQKGLHRPASDPSPCASGPSPFVPHLASDSSDNRMWQTQAICAGLPQVYEAAFRLILEHGWDALHGGENSGPAWTALHWAASEGRTDVCAALLGAAANPGHLDELGNTALDYALANNHHAIVEMLSSAQGTDHDRRWCYVDEQRV